MDIETPVRVVLDCSTNATALNASVAGILEQAAEAARSGDTERTFELFDLAREHADAAAGEPDPITIRAFTDEELDQLATDRASAEAAASTAADAAWAGLRRQRDLWLMQTDWMFLDALPSDLPADVAKAVSANRPAWAAFRQALRNLTVDSSVDPAAVKWPTPPAAPSVSFS